jgi:quercetin dioxygenase-like cupin family protein
MKERLTVLGIATALAFTYGTGAAPGQQPESTPIIVHEYEADFEEVAAGVSKAVLWSNHDKGSYGGFTRFEPEFDSGVHTYTNDIWIVVIQGAYVYKDDAGERRVERGDSIRIPGGTRHRSGGDTQWGALFYEESSALGFTYTAGDALTQQHKQDNAPVVVSMDEASFKEVAPGVSRAVLWGDHDKGPYGAFTEFEPEFDSGTNTQTNDIWIVVIQGFYLYKDDAGEKRLGPGDFIRIPGGTKHRSGGDKKWGTVFYEASDGKFDWVPAQ